MIGRDFTSRLRWFSFSLLAGAMLVALGITARVLEQALMRETEGRVRAEVALWSAGLDEPLARLRAAGAADSASVLALRHEVAAIAARRIVLPADQHGARVALFDRSGHRIADSNGAGLPPSDLAAVLSGRESPPLKIPLGFGRTRWDWTLPLGDPSDPIGAVQVTGLEVDPSPYLARLRLAFFVLAALGVLLALWFTTRSGRELQEGARAMLEQVEAIDRGVPAPPIVIHGWQELSPVTRALHQSAASLYLRLRELSRQLAQQDALLASMIESVVAVDREGMILLLNPAAGRLFEVEPSAAQGRSLREIARQTALHLFVQRAQESREVISEEIILPEEEERCLLAHGATLTTSEGQRIGALIVLHDITQLRRLENHRREFVANVSHELKTPITSIRGFVETLRDAPPDDPDERRRFLEIILRQADRLHAIIEDLLSLSRLEQEVERDRVPTEEVAAAPLLESALLPFRARAHEKRIAITIDCDPALMLSANPRLLEQAIANLIDNAIKYSEPDTAIRLRIETSSAEARIEVTDQGPGIESQHLPRLFERFYRVDKGRSRRLGGTGLGLAIVKHIAQAHGGTVTVDSQVGRGSTFRILLPLRDSRSSYPVLTNP